MIVTFPAGIPDHPQSEEDICILRREATMLLTVHVSTAAYGRKLADVMLKKTADDRHFQGTNTKKTFQKGDIRLG